MTDLIARYIHQVGRYLPPKERGEIEAELRSLIQDKLDDRYGGEPSPEELIAVLAEMGNPYQIASSYREERYLIGPNLYPWMMMVLSYGWLIVPSIMLFLSIFGVLSASQTITVTNLVIEPILSTLQATFIFSAVVVLIFAIIERTGFEWKSDKSAFNPANLPKTDDPRIVDRYESAFGSAFGIVVVLMFIYFFVVGGLTLRFNLSDPGDVIPIPKGWMLALILSSSGLIIVQLIALRHGHWTVEIWAFHTFLELFGAIAIYFAVYLPIFNRIVMDNPSLGDIPIPVIITIIYIALTVLNRGIKLVKLRNYQTTNTASFSVVP
ncbi:MAG: hypothetical protein SFZ02_20375 [bacterium]|nr:hypothetical protein [bacterium]